MNKSNNNKVLERIITIISSIISKEDFSIQFKNGIFELVLNKPNILKVAKTIKDHEKLKFNQFIDYLFD